MSGRRLFSLLALPAWILVAAVLPLCWPSPYLRELLLLANLNLVMVLSWDLYCGPSGELNCGHALFVGGGAYIAALLTRAGLAVGWAALLAVLAVAVGALVLGAVTRNLRGARFSLATMAFQIVFFQSLYLLPGVFGAEEGLSGLPGLFEGRGAEYALVLGLAGIAVLCREFIARGTGGLVLRAAGDDEAVVRASGISPARWRSLGFTLSAALAAGAGVLYALTQRHATPELASSELSIRLLLLALAGGAGPGPGIAVLAWFFLDELMAGVVPLSRLVVAAGLLVAVLVFRREYLGRGGGAGG